MGLVTKEIDGECKKVWKVLKMSDWPFPNLLPFYILH